MLKNQKKFLGMVGIIAVILIAVVSYGVSTQAWSAKSAVKNSMWHCATKDPATRWNAANPLLTGLTTTIDSAHFRVHYTPGVWSAGTPDVCNAAYAQQVSNSLEAAYTSIVTNFGFPAPPDSDNIIDVAVRSFPGDPDPANPNTWGEAMDYIPASDAPGDNTVTYSASPANVPTPEPFLIVINSALFQTAGDPASGPLVKRINAVTAHEFMHTVQANYDWYALGGSSWNGTLAWVEEGICKWIEDECYDADDEYLDWLNAYMDNPDRKITSLTYEAVLYWRFLSEHYIFGDGRWIIKQVLERLVDERPTVADNVTVTVGHGVAKYGEHDGIDNDEDGTTDEVGDGLNFYTFPYTLVHEGTCSEGTVAGLAPTTQGTLSYFARANYMKDNEYSEGASYHAIKLYDGTTNSTTFTGAQVNITNKTLNPFAADYIKIDPSGAAGKKLNIHFASNDLTTKFVVKVLYITAGGDFTDGYLALRKDSTNTFLQGDFAVLVPSNYSQIVVVITRTSSAGAGIWSVTLKEPAVAELNQFSINAGLQYLRCHQNDNGSWPSWYLGVTELDVLAFLNQGFDETDPAVKAAMKYIMSHYNAGGYFGNGLRNYETAIAVLDMVAADQFNNPKKYAVQIEAAKNWLLANQNVGANNPNCDDEAYTDSNGNGKWDPDELYTDSNSNGTWDPGEPLLTDWDNDGVWDAHEPFTDSNSNGTWDANPYYGGWGYSGLSPYWSDLSNTQWDLMALYAAGVRPPHSAYTAALRFISRCQNIGKHKGIYINDLYWDHDDGGLVYQPLPWGVFGSTSFGSMSYAGVWSYILCGVDSPADIRLKKALDWCAANFSVTANPNRSSTSALYYYYLTLAKAMAMAGGNASPADWFTQLTTQLRSLQHDTGYWVNTDNDELEYDQYLCTAYSLLAMETQTAEISNNYSVAFVFCSNVSVKLYLKSGDNWVETTNFTVNNSTDFNGDGHNDLIIEVPNVQFGNYKLEITGNETGSYDLYVLGKVNGVEVSRESFLNQQIALNEIQESSISVGALTGFTVHTTAPVKVGYVPGTTAPPANNVKVKLGGFCFIATAAYGSYLDPHVQILRDFRDQYLLTNPLGKALVAFYYKNSPPLANFIARHESLRAVTRLLLTPVVYAIEFPLAAAAVMMLIFAAIVFSVRRKALKN
jgi:hypothetical protein